MSTTRTRSQFTIRDSDPLVNSHRVDDIHILPGVALLDTIYKTLQARRVDTERVVLKNILFLEPVVTNAEIDRKLTVTLDLTGEHGKVTLTSVPWQRDRALTDQVTTHMTCTLAPSEPFTAGPRPALGPLPDSALDLDECYGVTRQIGISHEGFMKCSGRVASLPSGQQLAAIALGPEAAARASEFFLHPVLLDCSTIVPLFPLRARLARKDLFIPFAIEEFRALCLNANPEVRVLVDPLGTDLGDSELCRYSFGIYDPEGRQLAAIRNFTVKKVRSLRGIRGLLERSLAATKGSPTSQPPSAKPAPGRDPLGELIAELVSRQGQFQWREEHAHVAFFDLGLSSLSLLDAGEELEKRLGVRLYPTVLFENPSATALGDYLRSTFPSECAAYAQREQLEPPTTLRPTSARGAQPAPDASDALMGLVSSLMGPHIPGGFKSEHAEQSFFDLGLDSLTLLELADELEKRLDVRIYPTALFERPNARALVDYLREQFPEACAGFAGNGHEARPAAPALQVAKVPTPELSAHGASPAAPQPEILVPRWLPASTELLPPSTEAVALVCTDGDAGLGDRLAALLGARVSFRGSVSEFEHALETGLGSREVWLVALDHRLAFGALKALIDAKRLAQTASVRAFTLDCFSVHSEPAQLEAAHGVWGLLQSASREYPQLTVSQLDLRRAELEHASWLGFPLTASPTRTLRAVREGRIYQRALIPTRRTESGTPALRPGGNYLVIGGASGVGLEFVRHLRRVYDAHVAVVGRRSETPEIVRALAADGQYGRKLVYLSAAVEDEPALRRAIDQARATFGELHGVVHSAMVLEDARLVEMDAAKLARVLAPKAEGARVLARATAGLKLDLLLFFSSAQAFVGNLGQANYAAASTFIDGFAAGLRAERDYPVVVVNWGYWSEVGAVATERYRLLLARQGVHGLKSHEALAALEALLVAGWEQAAIVAAEEPVLREMGLDRRLTLERAAQPLPAVPALPAPPLSADDVRNFTETEQGVERLLALTRVRVAHVLRELLAGRTVEEAQAAGVLSVQHARLVQALLTMTRGEDGEQPLPEELANALSTLLGEYPSLEPLVPLLEACVTAYPALLAGKIAAPSVIFPGGSAHLVRPVYAESAVSRFYNQRVAEAVRSLSANRQTPLRILEIGAGTGSTTLAVLDSLTCAGIDCEYTYTDLWDKLLHAAKETLAPLFPRLKFAFLDIGLDPLSQGFREEYDIVIASNVLHATRELRATLRHVKHLLRPAGSLILNESVKVTEYSTYTFGLLPGWWNASDAHERLPDSPLASAARWPALLREAGFAQIRTLVPDDSGCAAAAAQQVYVAVSDGESRVATAKRPIAVPAAAVAHGLPAALRGKLRPFEPTAAPRPRHLATFKDGRDNVWVFLNNPPANMFSDEFLTELCATLQSVATLSPAAGRLVYLSHFGEYFSLGGDRSEILRHLGDTEALTAFADKARTLIHVITSLDALVVAVVNGTAQGGGLETLLATDLQIVRRGVTLGLPEIKSGLIPGMGGLSYLQHVVGPARAKRLALLGDLIEAQQAFEWGMISHVDDEPFAAALALGESVKNLNSASYMKRILRRDTAERLSTDIDDWLRYVTGHADWIDARRISNSRLVVAGRLAMKAS